MPVVEDWAQYCLKHGRTRQCIPLDMRAWVSPITELKTLAVVWATHFFSVTSTGMMCLSTLATLLSRLCYKHQTRRVKMPDGGVKCTRMVTRPSRVEQFQCRCIISCTCRTCSDDEIHVAAIQSKDISDFLRCDAERLPEKDLTEKQRRDPSVQEMIAFLEKGELPTDEQRARKVGITESTLLHC